MPKIYESPDGGKTVYEREFGSNKRELTLRSRIDILRERHKSLDEEIQMYYEAHQSDSIIRELKKKKLALKEEIAWLEMTFAEQYGQDYCQQTV